MVRKRANKKSEKSEITGQSNSAKGKKYFINNAATPKITVNKEVNQSLKVAIVGSRDFHDYEYLCNCVKDVINPEDISLIISGGAKGADFLAERFAANYKLKTKIFPANWAKFGSSAGPRRNKKIIEACDICIAFPTNNSTGTMHDIELCKKSHKRCFVFKTS